MSKPELAQYVSEGNEGQGRQYKHPFRVNESGKPLTSPSVTTILRLENKDSLIQWAVNETVKFCVANWSMLGSRSTEDATRGAKYRWKDTRDDRAFIGTGIHDTVEAEHTGSWNYPILNDEQELIMEEWRKFNDEWIIEPLLSEFTVWNFTHDYAGTGDGLWKFTNRKTGESFVSLTDIKTSRLTWDSHRLQVSALKNAEVLMVKVDKEAKMDAKGQWPKGAWVEAPIPDFDKLTLLHLRAPESNGYGNVVKPGIHDLIDVLDSDIFFEEFVGYRDVLRAQEKRKQAEKKREVASYGGF